MFADSNVAVTNLPTGGLNKNVGQTSKKNYRGKERNWWSVALVTETNRPLVIEDNARRLSLGGRWEGNISDGVYCLPPEKRKRRRVG